MKITIVDYSIGNVQSLFNALDHNNVTATLSHKEEVIMDSDGLILPGVGAFGKAMNELNKRDLPRILKNYVDAGKPLLGICLGMQLLLEESKEFGHNKGLGFIKGTVEKFPSSLEAKLPHVSWNELKEKKTNWKDTILSGIDTKEDFYFVHSFICKPSDPKHILAVTNYSEYEFCSVINRDNIYGCQFHPEKSSHSGLKVLKNFTEYLKK